MGFSLFAGLFSARGVVWYFSEGLFMESLILAQNERWRHGLGMQVERAMRLYWGIASGGRVSIA